jgi:hypothetical protein
LTTDFTNCRWTMEERPKNGKLSPMRLADSMCYGESYKYALPERVRAMLERMQCSRLRMVPNTPYGSLML